MQKPKTVSSQRWLKEHFNDEYVIRSKKEGWRSRAIYKLEEIDLKDKLIKSGMTIVDLGAAPGSWSQYAMHKAGHKGVVIALDILKMDPIAGVHIIEGDFREDAVLNALNQVIEGHPIDLIVSDIAPNASGIRSVDQSKMMYLLELVLDFSIQNLKQNGNLLMKVFQGEGFEAFLKLLKIHFSVVVTRKPKASRDRSPEIYLLAKGFRKQTVS